MVEQWIVAPKAVGSRPSSYPLNLFLIFKHLNTLVFHFVTINLFYLNFFFKNIKIVHKYYALNELLWQDGFLIDFLQKKSADNWVKKFVIFSGSLFNEKLLFDHVIKFYLTAVVNPLKTFFIFELTNVSNLIFINVFIFIFIFFIFTLMHLYLIV